MKIVIHLPRHHEAELLPPQTEDIVVKPKFYQKTGSTPVLYLSTVDNNGNEERFSLSVGAGNKLVKINRLVEVIPLCDERHENAAQITEKSG